MVKNIILTLGLVFCFAQADIYESNCVKCHDKQEIGIDKYFYDYLLVYSSEVNMKSAVMSYLKYPAKETSVMSDEEIKKYGTKNKTTLSEEELKKAVDIYWEKYKVFGKLK